MKIDIEVDGPLFLNSKGSTFKQPSNSTETIERRVVSYNKCTLKDYESCLEKKLAFIVVMGLSGVKKFDVSRITCPKIASNPTDHWMWFLKIMEMDHGVIVFEEKKPFFLTYFNWQKLLQF